MFRRRKLCDCGLRVGKWEISVAPVSYVGLNTIAIFDHTHVFEWYHNITKQLHDDLFPKKEVQFILHV
jgi:hypothetical protein